jgi:hypothetical protein
LGLAFLVDVRRLLLFFNCVFGDVLIEHLLVEFLRVLLSNGIVELSTMWLDDITLSWG